MTEETKPIRLLEKDTDLIIKTQYGMKNVIPCFGFMKINNPKDIECVPFLNPNEMEMSKKAFTIQVQETANIANKCTHCHLFDKCVLTSLLSALKGILK